MDHEKVTKVPPEGVSISIESRDPALRTLRVHRYSPPPRGNASVGCVLVEMRSSTLESDPQTYYEARWSRRPHGWTARCWNGWYLHVVIQGPPGKRGAGKRFTGQRGPSEDPGPNDTIVFPSHKYSGELRDFLWAVHEPWLRAVVSSSQFRARRTLPPDAAVVGAGR